MSKVNIPSINGAGDDWHEFMSSLGGQGAFADGQRFFGGLAVKVRGDDSILVTRAEVRGLLLAGGLVAVGAIMAVVGVLALPTGWAPGALAGIAFGLCGIGGGVLLCRRRRGVYMSQDGRELIVSPGLRRRFRLNAGDLIPRLTVPRESETPGRAEDVSIRLYNIKRRQSAVLAVGAMDYAGVVFGVLSGMLGSENLDSTLAKVKLAGLASDWTDIEPPRYDIESESQASPDSLRTAAPMRAGGMFFSGARIEFPRRGVAEVKLPFLRMAWPPVAITAVLWIFIMLVLSVVGGSLGVSERLAMLIGEISLAAMMVGVVSLFYYKGRPITIDRIKRTISCQRRARCGFTGEDFSTLRVSAVQLCCDAPPGADPKTDALRYELNLVLDDPPARLHLTTDSSVQRARGACEALAEFLHVKCWDCTGLDE